MHKAVCGKFIFPLQAQGGSSCTAELICTGAVKPNLAVVFPPVHAQISNQACTLSVWGQILLWMIFSLPWHQHNNSLIWNDHETDDISVSTTSQAVLRITSCGSTESFYKWHLYDWLTQHRRNPVLIYSDYKGVFNTADPLNKQLSNLQLLKNTLMFLFEKKVVSVQRMWSCR